MSTETDVVEELCDCGAPECELFNRLMRKLEEEQR